MAAKKLDQGVTVRAYVKCGECSTPYVLRMCIVFAPGTTNTDWVWQRDCKCRKPSPVIVKVSGRATATRRPVSGVRVTMPARQLAGG